MFPIISHTHRFTHSSFHILIISHTHHPRLCLCRVTDKLQVFMGSPTLGRDFKILGETFQPGLLTRVDNFDFLGFKIDLSVTSTLSPTIPEFWIHATFRMAENFVAAVFDALVKVVTKTFPDQLAKANSVFTINFKSLFPVETVKLLPFGIRGSVIHSPSLQIIFKQDR